VTGASGILPRMNANEFLDYLNRVSNVDVTMRGSTDADTARALAALRPIGAYQPLGDTAVRVVANRESGSHIVLRSQMEILQRAGVNLDVSVNSSDARRESYALSGDPNYGG